MAYVWRMAKAWRISEGRFFPISAIENVYTFIWVHDRLQFKLVQMVTLLLVAALAGRVAAQIAPRAKISVLVALMTLAMIQVQFWFDATIGFGLLLQSVSLKLLGATWLSLRILRSSSRLRAIFLWVSAFIVWLLAVFQYEIVLFVWPAMGLIVLMSGGTWGRRLQALSATLVPTAIAVITALVLRAGVVTSDGYRISLSGSEFWITFLQQIVASIPLSSTFLLNQSMWRLESWWVMASSSLVMMLVVREQMKVEANTSTKEIAHLAILGLSLMVLPAVPVAISAKWQALLSWGHGYLAVFLQYLGMAFLASSALLAVVSRTRMRTTVTRVLSTSIVVALLSGVAGVHAAGVIDVTNRIEPITWRRALYEEAVRDGFFSEIPIGASIISSSYNPNGWVNPWYYQWLGGNRSHRLSGTVNGMVASCTEAEQEGRCSLSGPWWGLAELPLGERETIVAIGLYERLDIDPMLTAMSPGTIRLYARWSDQLPLECKSELRKTESGNWSGSCGEEVLTLSQVAGLLNSGD
jgi:hypothetical protein